MARRFNHLTWIALAIVPAHAIARFGAEDNHQISANAGTGPYLTNLQSGLTDVGQGTVSRNLLAGIGSLISIQLDLKAPHLDGLASEFRTLDLISEDRRAWKGYTDIKERFGKFRDQIRSLLGQSRVGLTEQTALLAEAEKLISALVPAAFKAMKDDSGQPGSAEIGALKSGIYIAPHSSFQFDTLLYSPGEYGSPNKSRCAPFYSASLLVPLEGLVTNPSGRIGAGFAFGNPDRKVYVVGLGAYVSPYALDSQVGLSYRVGPYVARAEYSDAVPDQLDELEKGTRQPVRRRVLMDHVRSGDVWLGASYRSISYSSSSALPDGQVYEGSFTWSLRERDCNANSPIPSTTVCISGAYCRQKALGIDDFGIELRSPIVGKGFLDRPTYLSFRYGNRSHYTIAIEGHF